MKIRYLIVAGLLATAAIQYQHQKPAYSGELAKVKHDAKTLHGANVKTMADATRPIMEKAKAPNHIVDVGEWRDKALPVALQSAAIDNTTDELRATLERQTVGQPALVVDPRIDGWQFSIPVKGPLQIEAEGEVCGDGECVDRVTPNGKYADGLPESFANMQLAGPGLPYLSLIGHVCQGEAESKNCGTPFFIGKGRAICPDRVGEGYLELRVNEIIGAWGLLDPQWHANNQGGFRFRFQPAPSAACQ